jgi:spore coat protein H
MKKIELFILILSLFFFLNSCKLDVIDLSELNVESFERLFDDTVQKSITIKISQGEWNYLDSVMIDYYNLFGNYRTDYYAKADLVYEDPSGLINVKNIGFRTRGNLSRVRIQEDDGTLNLSNFKISFHQDFDLKEFASLKDRTVFGLEELDMKVNRNNDGTYLSEKFSLDLFSAFNVYAAKTTLANLYIEIGGTSHYYGVYTLFEPIDEQFLKRRLDDGMTDGNLYKSLWQSYGPAALQTGYDNLAMGIKDESMNYRPAYDLKTNKKVPDHTELIDFIFNINNLNGEDFQEYIEANFEVDMMLRLLAIGVLLGNPDDYRAMGNNYYFYQNSLSGKWVMIPYDYDHGLGQGWDGAPVFTNWTVGYDIYEWGNLNEVFTGQIGFSHPLSDKLLSIESYQILYESYLDELIDPESDLFDYEVFYQKYLEQRNLYDEVLVNAMMHLPFDLRNSEAYFTDKITDIQAQLLYYQTFPNLRGF